MDISDAKRSALRAITEMQTKWAQGAGVEPEPGFPLYARDRSANFFEGVISPETLKELGEGSGSELEWSPDGRRPPKICSLASSAALAVNVFDYWRRNRDLTTLVSALGATHAFDEMRFEDKYPTGRAGPCNLDVSLKVSSANDPDKSWVFAIESKFTEPFSSVQQPLKPWYLPPVPDPSPWFSRGLSKTDKLARQLGIGIYDYQFLDGSQLVKHIFGLHRKLDAKFTLGYFYYDASGEAGEVHRKEIETFAEAVTGEVNFVPLSYQELVRRLKTRAGATSHAKYFEYLAARYGLG